MNEIELAVSKVDPKKKVEVGGFRLDVSGDSKGRMIPYAKSEMYLTELMENICDKMDDYAKARYKSNGKPTVLKMVTDSGMNPDMGKVDFVQEGDLNKSLKHFCLEILEDYEEDVLKIFMAEGPVKDVDITLCSQKAKYCNELPIEDDYELEDHEEL